MQWKVSGMGDKDQHLRQAGCKLLVRLLLAPPEGETVAEAYSLGLFNKSLQSTVVFLFVFSDELTKDD